MVLDTHAHRVTDMEEQLSLDRTALLQLVSLRRTGPLSVCCLPETQAPAPENKKRKKKKKHNKTQAVTGTDRHMDEGKKLDREGGRRLDDGGCKLTEKEERQPELHEEKRDKQRERQVDTSAGSQCQPERVDAAKDGGVQKTGSVSEECVTPAGDWQCELCRSRGVADTRAQHFGGKRHARKQLEGPTNRFLPGKAAASYTVLNRICDYLLEPRALIQADTETIVST